MTRLVEIAFIAVVGLLAITLARAAGYRKPAGAEADMAISLCGAVPRPHQGVAPTIDKASSASRTGGPVGGLPDKN